MSVSRRIAIKMKFLVVLCAVVACAVGDVSHILKDESSAPILKSDFDITPEGQYQYAYETGNGINAQEQGSLKNINSEQASIDVKGAFGYISPDGTPIQLSYSADENGYQPQGSHLPVPPPIPELIARSLAYIAAHPPAVAPAGPSIAKAASLYG